MYAPNNRTTNYERLKLIEMQGEICKSNIAVRYFNSPISIIGRSETENQ